MSGFGDYLLIAAAAFPAFLLMLAGISRRLFIAAWVIAIFALPAGMFYAITRPEDPSPATTEEQASSWGDQECSQLGGATLLMRDTRPGRWLHWWVMCSDGSKSAIVKPPPAGGLNWRPGDSSIT